MNDFHTSSFHCINLALNNKLVIQTKFLFTSQSRRLIKIPNRLNVMHLVLNVIQPVVSNFIQLFSN